MSKINDVHFFNVSLATAIGIEEAILYQNLCYWVSRNKANDMNKYDGKYWTYNSANAFKDLFPYMSEYKIYRCLSRLEELGYIQSGNYNKSAYDRTKWYTITDKLQNKDIHFAKSKMDSQKNQNGLPKNQEPIPNINTNINTDNKTNNINSPAKAEQDIPYKEIVDYLNDKTNSRYRNSTRKTKTLIKARWNEGFDLEDFKSVIDIKSSQWLGDKEMSKYLRPQTLFGTKFEAYLNEEEVRSIELENYNDIVL